MEEVSRRQFQKLTPCQILRYRDNVHKLHRLTGGTLIVGSACSGTDSFMHALNVLIALWKRHFGLTFTARHAFACENVQFKQHFLEQHWDDVECLFPDVTMLGERKTENSKGFLEAVPWCHIFNCGIECDSVSALNKNRKEHRSCVATATDKTGATAAGCVAYISTHKPLAFMLENVKQLNNKDPVTKKSNLDLLIEMFNDMGYLCRSWSLDPMNYGIPQKRERRYIVGVLAGAPDDDIDQFDASFVPPQWFGDVDAYLDQLAIEPLSIRRFLLRDGDPKLEEALEELKAQGKDSDQGPKEPEEKVQDSGSSSLKGELRTLNLTPFLTGTTPLAFTILAVFF